MSEVLASEPPAGTGAGPSGPGSHPRRRLIGLGAVALAVLVAAVVALLVSSSGATPPATGAAAIVPSDALAYVNVSLDSGRPAVGQSLRVAARFPDYALASAAVQTRLGEILSGGHSIDFGGQVRPWLGNEAALALLNTTTSTAGTLIILDVRNPSAARAFLRGQGATSQGSYRGTQLLAYPSGSQLAFVSHFLVVGQAASVRSAIDVAAGATQSLAGSSVYQRATSTEPPGRVLDAYASLAGVRRVLSPQGGVIGAVGDLLYQPALQGVALSLSPAAGGARVQIHSALDPTLARLNPSSTPTFTPTLQNVMPAGSMLMLDVHGLNRVAPAVLNAGSAAGVAGGIGPLLARLGAALSAEGVNVHNVTSIFSGETAVAIVPHQKAPTLVVVARTSHPTQVQTELAELQIPLAQLFKPPRSTAGQTPSFNERSVGGVTDHQLALANGLQLNYAIFRGLVVISTSTAGIAAVAQRAHSLAADPGYDFVLGRHPTGVTSLVYLDLRELLALGQQTGLTSGASLQRLHADLDAISSVGLTSSRSADQSSARLSLRVP